MISTKYLKWMALGCFYLIFVSLINPVSYLLFGIKTEAKVKEVVFYEKSWFSKGQQLTEGYYPVFTIKDKKGKQMEVFDRSLVIKPSVWNTGETKILYYFQSDPNSFKEFSFLGMFAIPCFIAGLLFFIFLIFLFVFWIKKHKTIGIILGSLLALSLLLIKDQFVFIQSNYAFDITSQFHFTGIEKFILLVQIFAIALMIVFGVKKLKPKKNLTRFKNL